MIEKHCFWICMQAPNVKS